MARPILIFLLALFLNTGTGNEPFLPSEQSNPSTAIERGRALAQRIDERDTGRDSRVAMRMRLFDRQGRVRERALSITGLRGGPGRAVPHDRSLTRFTEPADIRGTGFLVWEQASGDDERFLYLPSLGRVRRIAGSEAQESFVASDFTYEDIGGRELEAFDYRLLDENATWTASDGATHPAFLLESRRKDPNARFPRVESLVRKDNVVVVAARIYNRRDEVQKIFTVSRVEKTGAYWTVMAMTMSDTQARTRTELVVERAEYDVGLRPEDFTRRELERPMPASRPVGRSTP